MPNSIRTGDVLADRYRMLDLLHETEGGFFWRAFDQVLTRHVAFQVIGTDDRRAGLLLDAAKQSATVPDSRILRVLDADQTGGLSFVVNEWGSGQSLDVLVADGPLTARRAAWIVSEVAETITTAHAVGQAHGRLVPENVLIDHNGSVKIIGFAVDAALHGLPPGRRSADTVDLAGLLYAALIGKWPGISRSKLPPAPQSGGQPLRPRRVRAGIPGALDQICEEVLSPFASLSGDHLGGIETAAGIREALVSFVGDPGELAAAEKDQVSAMSWPATFGPQAQPAHEADPANTGSQGDPDVTVAGVPAFETEWLSPRKDPPPPPPEFEQPPERPLYAADPVRRPRAPVPGQETGGASWPWETTSGDTGGMASSGGRGAGRSVPGLAPGGDPVVPGRSFLRLAGGVAAALLLVTAVAFAFTLGRDSGSGGGTPDPAADSPSTKPARAGKAIEVSGIQDFDPQGDPPEEYPELAANAIDGDPATTWKTSNYLQNFGPGGLKSGVGLLLDLGKTQGVTSVEVNLVGAPTGLSVYLADQPPAGAPTGEPAAGGTAQDTSVTLRLNAESPGRYVLVWLTSLPGSLRGEIGEIVVRS